MKYVIAMAAVLSGGMAMLATTEEAKAVVYCTYIGYPAGCVAKPGVVLVPAPAVRAVTPGVGAPGVGVPGVGAPGVGAPGVGVRPGVPGNHGGPVNRVGPR
jgi:hypothetical protein